MTTSQPSGSGVAIIAGRIYPAFAADDPIARAALDARYEQLISDWEYPVGEALERLRAVFGATPASGPAKAA